MLHTDIYYNHDKSSESKSQKKTPSTALVIKDGREYQLGNQPHLKFEKKFFEYALTTSQTVTPSVQIMMRMGHILRVKNLKDLNDIIPSSIQDIFSIIDKFKQPKFLEMTNVQEVQDEKSLTIFKGVFETFNQWIDSQKRKIKLVGVTSLDEFTKQLTAIADFEEQAMEVYVNNLKNIENNFIIDQMLIHYDHYDSSFNKDHRVKISQKFWASVHLNPSLCKRMKKAERVFLRIWNEELKKLLEATEEYVNEKHFPANISEPVYRVIKISINQFFEKSFIYNSEEEERIKDYILLQATLMLPSFSKIILYKNFKDIVDRKIQDHIRDSNASHELKTIELETAIFLMKNNLEDERNIRIKTDLMNKINKEKDFLKNHQMKTSDDFYKEAYNSILEWTSLDQYVAELSKVDSVKISFQNNFGMMVYPKNANINLSKLKDPIPYFVEQLIKNDEKKFKILGIPKE